MPTPTNRPPNEPAHATARWFGWLARWLLDEFLAGWRSAESDRAVGSPLVIKRSQRQDDVPSESMPSWEKLLVIAAPTALVSLLVIDLTDKAVREYFVAHALLAGVVSGGLLLGPPLLLIERSLERAQRNRDLAREWNEARASEQREREERARWKRPAEDAIETYLYTADAFTKQLGQHLAQTARDLNAEPAAPTWPGDWWLAIADHARQETFSDLYEFVHEAASRSGAIAITATNTLALYTPLSSYVEQISEIQRQTRAIAEQCNSLWHFQQMGNRPSLEDLRRTAIDKLGRHTENRAHLLAGIMLDLERAAPSVDLPLQLGEDQP